jgi:hypothetical protein
LDFLVIASAEKMPDDWDTRDKLDVVR